jgi:hypothetical protein
VRRSRIRCKIFSNCFGARFGPEIAFAVNADAHCIGFHVALSNHEHRVDFHLLSALDFAVDLVGAFFDFCGLGQGSELKLKEGCMLGI